MNDTVGSGFLDVLFGKPGQFLDPGAVDRHSFTRSIFLIVEEKTVKLDDVGLQRDRDDRIEVLVVGVDVPLDVREREAGGLFDFVVVDAGGVFQDFPK